MLALPWLGTEKGEHYTVCTIAMETSMTFDGRADEAVLADLRALFLKTRLPYTVIYVVLALLFLALAVVSADTGDRFFMIFVAAGVLVARYSRPLIAWRQNLSAWKDVLEMRFTGTVTEADVWIHGTPEPAPWQKFIAAKESDRALLLYVSQADCLPFHLSFFAEQREWEDLVALARRKIRRWWRLPSSDAR